jgi:hypothetical protein
MPEVLVLIAIVIPSILGMTASAAVALYAEGQRKRIVGLVAAALLFVHALFWLMWR